MVYIDPEFDVPTVPEDQQYEGTELDANVRAALPEGTKIDWVATYGASFWAISTKVDTELPSGKKQSYFLKVYTTKTAKDMAQGELAGSKAMYALIPDQNPRPITAGPLSTDSKKHFFLAEFRDMTDELPAASELASVMAKYHQSKSPNGKFGFHITTFHGDYPMNNEWCYTWEECFTRMMIQTLQDERQIQGRNEEMDKLAVPLVSKVIPRLLRPMETNGRRIEPVLIHGDLWHGNIGVDNITDEPVLYDPCVWYGHNEFEFHTFRAARYRTNRPHVRAYHKIVDMTPPTADHDDRNGLYALHNDLRISILWSANKRTRQLALEEMRRLVAKYPDGYEGYQDLNTNNAK